MVEHKDKIPEDVKAEVQTAIDAVKAVQESEDDEDIKAKVQALQVSIYWWRVAQGGWAGGGVGRGWQSVCVSCVVVVD